MNMSRALRVLAATLAVLASPIRTHQSHLDPILRLPESHLPAVEAPSGSTLPASQSERDRPDPETYHPDPAWDRAGAADLRSAKALPEPDARERTPSYWSEEAAAGIRERLLARGDGGAGRARNVVLFLGDGMSLPTLAAARALLGQRSARPGEEARLHFEGFPSVGLAKTYCVNAQVPDSACTATAYLCGVKANRGTVGVTAAVPRRNCAASQFAEAQVDSIAAWALADGRDAGIVTTTRVTHASPAGAYASAANRQWENDARVREDGVDPRQCRDIAHQLVHHYPGKEFKVILGGGRREFLHNETRDEEGTRGRREDGRDLINEWRVDKLQRGIGHEYIWNRSQLRALMDNPPEYLLGLFQGTHLPYHLEGDPDMEPTLAELTETAIRSLSRNERGFFLFVEAGRIDHAHHDNYPHLALDETLELHEAVRRATELLDARDSLVVVTADHSHVMTYNGYSMRGADILGASDDRGDDRVPYMTLSYANGPGARAHGGGVRPDVTQDADFRALDWRSHAEVPLEEETHGGDDVAVFARGPHHDLFSGLYEQSQLPHLMGYAACLGPGPTVCRTPAAPEDDSVPPNPAIPSTTSGNEAMTLAPAAPAVPGAAAPAPLAAVSLLLTLLIVTRVGL